MSPREAVAGWIGPHDRRGALERERDNLELLISHFLEAVGKGGDIPSLVEKLRDHERRELAFAQEL